MKKNIYLLLLILAGFVFTGCGTKDTMVNFIPTPIPELEDSVDEGAGTENIEDIEDTTEATPTPKEIHVGQTKTMYVKLDTYGAFLNVRSKPSKDGEKVGFLVHAEKVEVIEIVDGWASFEAKNKVCYVSADFLVEERPTYIPAPTATPIPTPTPDNTPTPIETPTPTPDPNELPPEI